MTDFLQFRIGLSKEEMSFFSEIHRETAAGAPFWGQRVHPHGG
jgi:hypothetical protein